MKRLKITTLVFASTMVLMGCTQQTTSENNNEDNKAASQTVENTEQSSTEASTSTQQSVSSESTEETSTVESAAATSTTETESSEIKNELADLEEGTALQDTIGDVDNLNVETATDNPNKRVLLFSNDEGEKQYKSVFIKQKKRLKIIDITNDDLLMNQEID